MKKIKLIWITSGIISILFAVFFPLYYYVILENHEGFIDWWAIVIISIPIVILMITRILIFVRNIEIEESFRDKNVFEKIGVLINKIIMLISTVLVLPIGFVFLIISIIYNCFTVPGKRSFKKLISKGFKYKFENKTYILTRNSIVIWVFTNFEDYYISFDEGKNFIKVEESNLGTDDERNVLSTKLNTYKNAHPVDKQRGDVTPPISDFIDFLVSAL